MYLPCAILSFIGSSWLLWHILYIGKRQQSSRSNSNNSSGSFQRRGGGRGRNSGRGNNGTTYHRILIGISISDIISSLALIIIPPLNYTINPNLSIQYWGQPFISTGNYSEFKHVSDPLAAEFNDRFTPYSDEQLSLTDNVYSVDENLDGNVDFSFDNPDFSFVQFRSNLVVRWEYIPGSEIFLVWSQDISQSGDPSQSLFAGLEDNLFNGERPTNIFLIKATYRFVF